MELISVIVIWQIFGLIPCICWISNARASGWELCNPYWYHRYYQVNWFGAIMGSLVYTLCCPACAVIYWFYKICTFGRSKIK